MNHLPNGLVLLNIVVDIERVGDYTKNILDLAMNHPKKIIAKIFLQIYMISNWKYLKDSKKQFML